MNTWLWRRVRRQIDRVVPPERSAAVIGDLQEDYARRRTTAGKLRASVWLLREARSLARAYRSAAAAPGKAWRPFTASTSDVRYAVRRLRTAPTFAAFAVLTLALGIGATTAIYSVIRSAMSPPPGVTTLDRLVTITHSEGGSVPMIALSYGDFEDLRVRQTTFQDLAGWTYLRVVVGTSGQGDTSWGERVTGDYFRVLGVNTMLGRPLQPADDDARATAVAVISHGLWQRVFGGARDAIGRVLKVNGQPFEIVGVAAREFAGLFNNGLVPTSVWVPLKASERMPGARDYEAADRTDRSNRWLQVRARLRDGATLELARAEIRTIAAQLDLEQPLESPSKSRPSYNSSRPWVVRMARDTVLNEGADRFVVPMAATVMGAVCLVLLVACTNLANLILARGSARREEIAVRLALGASRGRLIRAELTEALLLAVAGGLSGLGIARVVLVLLGNDVPVGNNTFVHFVPKLDVAVLLMSGAATLLALLVAGLLPALQSTRADLRSAISSATGAALPRWRGRRLLIAGQVTVSMILVALAGLCVAQLREQARVQLGVDLDRLALVEVDFASQQYQEPRVRQILDALVRGLAQRPGITKVSISSGLPAGLGTPGSRVGDAAQTLAHGAELVASTSTVFETLGMRLVRGQAWDDRAVAGAAPVAVISESTARSVFGSLGAVGRSIFVRRDRWVGEPEHPVVARTVIGVASDTKTGAARTGAVYLPFSQHYEGRLVIAARTDDDPAALVTPIRRALSAADPELVVTQAGTGLAIAGPSNVFLQVTAGLTGILGGFALALALVGLYGVLSHVVLRRRREIGLRMALGASRPEILRMVLRDGLRPVILGIGLGLVFGAITRLWLTSIFDRLLPAIDPFVLVVVPAGLLACGIAACLVPARRASRVDPNLALRDL